MPSAIHLSDYVMWEDRGALPTGPGIYVISKPECGQVVYVGKTWNKDGLRKRVQQFHRSATTGMPGHAGGVTYNSVFGTDVSDLTVRTHTPVAINPDADILQPYIQYAERRLIWEFVERHGKLPACNSE